MKGGYDAQHTVKPLYVIPAVCPTLEYFAAQSTYHEQPLPEHLKVSMMNNVNTIVTSQLTFCFASPCKPLCWQNHQRCLPVAIGHSSISTRCIPTKEQTRARTHLWHRHLSRVPEQATHRISDAGTRR